MGARHSSAVSCIAFNQLVERECVHSADQRNSRGVIFYARYEYDILIRVRTPQQARLLIAEINRLSAPASNVALDRASNSYSEMLDFNVFKLEGSDLLSFELL